MTSLRIALAAAAVLALAAVPAALAQTMTIKVRSDTVVFKQRDLAPKGTSKGDTIIQRDRLVNAVAQFGKKKGAVIGSDSGTVTFTSAHTATYEGTTTLPGGTLKLRGTVTLLSDGSTVFKVAGGTGKFAGMQGTVTVGPQRNHVLNTYRLTRSTTGFAA
jgi:autotransporter-associated beta strand protein